MTGAATWGLVALGVVIGWCARTGLTLWQETRRPSRLRDWARSRRQHQRARAKLRALQEGTTGGIQLWT